jgi:hypothetical protein
LVHYNICVGSTVPDRPLRLVVAVVDAVLVAPEQPLACQLELASVVDLELIFVDPDALQHHPQVLPAH